MNCDDFIIVLYIRKCWFIVSIYLLILLLIILKLEPGVSLPPPDALKRKIIIKNKRKHRTHHKKQLSPSAAGDSMFHIDLDQSGENRSVEIQGNGEIPRPQLVKEGSRESSEEEPEAPGKLQIFEMLWLRE